MDFSCSKVCVKQANPSAFRGCSLLVCSVYLWWCRQDLSSEEEEEAITTNDKPNPDAASSHLTEITRILYVNKNAFADFIA